MNNKSGSYSLIMIPEFEPKYDSSTQYGYDDRNKQRENLRNLLVETSNNYCMYCYRRIVIDRIDYSQIEHAIEKGTNKNSKLRNCVPNLGLACSKCNTSFKRRNEKFRVLDIQKHKEYDVFNKHKCKPSKCKKACDDYKNLLDVYHNSKYGHICLKPGLTVFPKTKHVARIQYNIFKGQFEPASSIDYTSDEIAFIYDHINQFNLNDPDKRPDEFYNYCRDVINNKVNVRAYNHYNNYIVDLFIESVKALTDAEILKLCKTALLMAKKVGRV